MCDAPPDTVPAEETLDHLVGDWRIYQLRRGHRYSTDDLLTAWTAVRALPEARRVLDLGAGVGSVGLLVLHRLGLAARLTSVEVQAVSVALARKTVARNGLQQRVQLRHADLRDPAALGPDQRFELVVANPPYLPQERAVRSPHPQRAAARLELHGDVFDYCRVAARRLDPGGRFCFSHAAVDPRPQQAVEQAGLTLLARQDVVFRQGDAPMIALFTCGHEGTRRDPEPLTVRDSDRQWSAGYVTARRQLGVDP